jgi:hypothetical protein
LPLQVAAALLASAEGYTPRANNLLDRAREELGAINEVATALADNLPAPKAPARKSRRRRKKRRGVGVEAAPSPDGAVASSDRTGQEDGDGSSASAPAEPALEIDGTTPAAAA